MNFDTFLDELHELQNGIAITSPTGVKVRRSYWGAPAGKLADLPCIINTMSEPNRVLGFGSREQSLQITVQLMVKEATTEDQRSARIATALWYAAKDAFDKDVTIGGTVPWSTLQGASPTVPVLLTHGGLAYIGFNAVLQIQDIEGFDFG